MPKRGKKDRRGPKSIVPARYRLTPAELDAELEKWKRLIHKIAGWWRMRNPRVDYEELVQEVYSGFVYAGRYKFDKRGKLKDGKWLPVKFCTYAKYWGDNFARTYVLNETAHGFRVPDLGGKGFPMRDYRPQSLSASADDDMANNIADREQPPPGPDANEFWKRVRCILDRQHYAVLSLRFRGTGKGGSDDLTLADVGRIVGLCKERVRQVVEESLADLREHPGLFDFFPAIEGPNDV